GGVDDRMPVGGEECADGAGDLVGQGLARPEIAHVDGVPLVAFEVRRPEQACGVVRDVEGADREVLVPFGL
ncbi:hypothetical protein ABE10_02890, partial [Bacillus toyonensis]|nr:hypothetical protein [Bacillus toyonensis]